MKVYIFIFGFTFCFFPQIIIGQWQSTTEQVPSRVESMYMNGLHYLKTTQRESGDWSGMNGDEPGVVGLALMAILAHGDDPNIGEFKDTVERCIQFILSHQNKNNGYIGSSMYTHGFATLALAESYGMVNNPNIGPALKKAVDLIIYAQEQNQLGAWRYSPEANDADTTVTGCQMMALFAAKNAGIPVPDSVLDKAQKFMYSCMTPNGAYGYTSPSTDKITLTAIGSLVQSIGKRQQSSKYQETLKFLESHLTHKETAYPFYYEYYMAQALFHGDETLWNKWNFLNIKNLQESQQQDGSWDCGQSKAYSTAMALLSLAINYRFLPIYEK